MVQTSGNSAVWDLQYSPDGVNFATALTVTATGGTTGMYQVSAYYPYVKFAARLVASAAGGTRTFTRVKIFVWNPLTMSAQLWGTEEGSWADTVSDWGSSELNRYNHTIETITGYFDEDNSLLYITGETTGAAVGGVTKTFFGLLGSLNISGGEDVLPPYIIYKILTSPVYGIGIDSDLIDQDSYQLALAYCDAEGIRVSTI